MKLEAKQINSALALSGIIAGIGLLVMKFPSKSGGKSPGLSDKKETIKPFSVWQRYNFYDADTGEDYTLYVYGEKNGKVKFTHYNSRGSFKMPDDMSIDKFLMNYKKSEYGKITANEKKEMLSIEKYQNSLGLSDKKEAIDYASIKVWHKYRQPVTRHKGEYEYFILARKNNERLIFVQEDAAGYGSKKYHWFRVEKDYFRNWLKGVEYSGPVSSEEKEKIVKYLDSLKISYLDDASSSNRVLFKDIPVGSFFYTKTKGIGIAKDKTAIEVYKKIDKRYGKSVKRIGYGNDRVGGSYSFGPNFPGLYLVEEENIKNLSDDAGLSDTTTRRDQEHLIRSGHIKQNKNGKYVNTGKYKDCVNNTSGYYWRDEDVNKFLELLNYRKKSSK